VIFSFIQGSEAAAATAVTLKRKRRVASSVEPIEFRANRPFIFMIREYQNDLTLFSGKFVSFSLSSK